MSIKETLKEARKKKGYTQQELADMLGVTDRAISNWETGKRLPDYTLIYSLCDKLDIDINKLFMSDEELIKKYYKDRVTKAGIILSIFLLTVGVICVLSYRNIYPVLAGIAIIIYILFIIDAKKLKDYKKIRAIIESVKKLYFIKINKKSFRTSIYKDSYFPLLVSILYIVDGKKYLRKKIIFKDISLNKGDNISIIYQKDRPSRIKTIF